MPRASTECANVFGEDLLVGAGQSISPLFLEPACLETFTVYTICLQIPAPAVHKSSTSVRLGLECGLKCANVRNALTFSEVSSGCACHHANVLLSEQPISHNKTYTTGQACKTECSFSLDMSFEGRPVVLECWKKTVYRRTD